MDALPFIIEMLSEMSFKDFLSKNGPHLLNNLDFVVQELFKVQRYMRWSDFENQPEDQKQVLIKGLRLTVNKVGKFMGKIHAQFGANRDSSSSQDHDFDKTTDDLVKEWRDILNIFAGIVYCCYKLKGNQTEKEYPLEEVFGEDFEERLINDNITSDHSSSLRNQISSSDDHKTSDPEGATREDFEEMERINNITGMSDEPETSDQGVVEPTKLNEKKSLQLFLIKACPDLNEYSEHSRKKTFLLELSKELDNIPQLICKACNGLPLALVLVGSLLSLKEKINDIWNGVKDALYTFNDHGSRLSDIINYCYEDLPYFLKPCFLYLACYPEGHTIPSRYLINIWIAEGFISAEEKDKTLEETAYKYLEQLVKRSLVIDVSKRSLSGTIKCCHINPVIHKYAINKAKEEGFLVANPDQQTIESSFRVALHSDNKYPYEELEIAHMHSFLAFDFKQNILQSAVLLRVLELQGSTVPNEEALQKMTYLRYLGLRYTSIDALPESIGVMQNLHSLDVRNTNIKTLPESLWNISKLRHVYVLLSPEIKGPPPGAKLTDLQTLKTVVVPESWVGECPQFLINLRKLALSKPKDLDRDWKFVSSLLSQLVGLLSLTIISDSVPSEFIDTRAFQNLESVKSIKLEGEWICRNLFIDNVKIPPNLTKLTLTKSGLKEDIMPRLGRLKALKFLCLQADAYNGEQMVCLVEGFPQLQFLELSNLKCLKKWEVREEGFSQLQSLKLIKLENLEEWVVEEKGMSKLTTLRILKCKKLKNRPNLTNVTDQVIDD
ncbi:Disease resistance protein (CC-NBS-LRR class) family protein [Rhynchospora pubera]|uniref:Disease resistance protein (CC-NBS-LRR class) family protein n=1 Tax=Rhynchospora pubera TaxID=906938 RepID=A0AAV8ARC2_9POAL|nr:Disease resistance protein (CC-NBS-LRR class) family protein [Rhynchospora pubera]KAJ4745645.1 Disease resistance protein (CC-NBS-LRR class) family protein [Rhynchospora pubera]KAJ4801259.1 Disease resistance protein (CC-NBS-LRR class) family protein [Rhynchospora pubera]